MRLHLAFTFTFLSNIINYNLGYLKSYTFLEIWLKLYPKVTSLMHKKTINQGHL